MLAVALLLCILAAVRGVEVTDRMNVTRQIGGNRPLCGICMAIIGDLDKALEKPWEEKIVEKIATVECEAIEGKGECMGVPECKDLCKGIIREYAEEVADLWIGKYLGPRFLCGQLKKCDPPPSPPPPPLPFTQKLGDTGDRSTNKGIGYIVQVGDVHWDPWYSVGSPSKCNEPACCRSSDNDLGNNTEPAGPFGNLNNCDAPTSVVASMFDYIAAIHKSKPIDFAICDGDGPPHDIWNQSKARHIQIISGLTTYFKKALPNVPTYYIVGNHEGMPVDQFENPPDDNWLYGNMSVLFKNWVDRPVSGLSDTPSASSVLAYGGFYTTLYAPGLRIVSINCGYFDGGNYWLNWVNATTDMARQFEWLSNVFAQSRALKETVFLLQHFPMGSFAGFQKTQYYNLYIEYRDIIRTVFSGHTHVDNFHLWGAMSDAAGYKPFAINYSPGSVTTYGGRWPQFRIYTYDRASNEMLDYEHYHMDVGKSNAQGKAMWERGYSARATYGLPDLRPESWEKMVLSMNKNPNLYDAFQRNTLGGLPHSFNQDINGTICSLLSATPSDMQKCRTLHPGILTVEGFEEMVNPPSFNLP